MKPHEVFILVILCILTLYILLIILDLIFVFSFKSILRKHNKSLAVILNTKYDNIQKMISVIDKYGITIDSPALKEFENIDVKDLNKQYTAKCKAARDILSILRNELVFLSSSHPILEQDEIFVMAKENIIQLDDVYRVNIAMYNADVLGYNYWIRFLPCRYIFLLLKTKTKDLI